MWSIYYLQAHDLGNAIVRTVTDAEGLWLEFGTDISVYADIMPRAIVETADLRTDDPDLIPTYQCTLGEMCPAPSDRFDGIMSTQVLEHVADTPMYLRDAWRMLRPGGRLVVTTHGIWQDHPDPADYRRWTADGLRYELEQTGFLVRQVTPLTCRFRALVALTIAMSRPAPPGNPPGVLFPIKKLLFRTFAVTMNAIARVATRGQAYDQETLGPNDKRIYIGLLAVAEKPQDPTHR
jgi:SAM-dependent methyltransferase